MADKSELKMKKAKFHEKKGRREVQKSNKEAAFCREAKSNSCCDDYQAIGFGNN